MPSEKQRALESEMAATGRAKYFNALGANRRNQRETATPAGRSLLRAAVTVLAHEYGKWRKKARGGVGKTVVELLSPLAPSAIASISCRVIIDRIALANNMRSAARAVGGALEDEARMVAIKKLDPLLYREVCKSNSKKNLSLGRRRKHARKLHEEVVKGYVPWSAAQRMYVGTVICELFAAYTGIVERQYVHAGKRKFIVLVPTKETVEWLDKAHDKYAEMMPFYMPTFDEPLPWAGVRDGGYLTTSVRRRTLVKSSDRRQLDEVEAAGLERVQSAINSLQSVKFRVDPVVLATATKFVQSGGAAVGIVEARDVVRPPKPEDPELVKPWKIALAKEYQRVREERAQRLALGRTLHVARRMGSNAFHYPHEVDFRGRAYPTPYFLQPQGDSLSRGLLLFDRPCHLATDDAVFWFKVHGANCFGRDKEQFEDRVKWVDDNASAIVEVAEHPEGTASVWGKAESPWQFLAWCVEYAQWAKRGRKFESRVPVFMDGTNNGLQIYSLLMRDETLARSTNCAGDPRRQDVYAEVAAAATKMLYRALDNAEEVTATPEQARYWLDLTGGKLPRAAVKRQVMTLPYGLTFHSAIGYTREWALEFGAERGVKLDKNDDAFFKAVLPLASVIWGAIDAHVGPAKKCMQWLQQIAGVMTDAELPIRWRAPSGFLVIQQYRKSRMRMVCTAVAGKTRYVHWNEDVDELSRRRQVNAIAPNFVHSLDAAAMVDTVNACFARGVRSFASVHDSFGVLASDAALCAGELRRAYCDIFSENQLERFRNDVQLSAPEGVSLPEVPRGGDFEVNQVLASKYFFA